MNGNDIGLIKEMLQTEIKSLTKEVDLIREDNYNDHTDIKKTILGITEKVECLKGFKDRLLGVSALLSIILAAAVSLLIKIMG